MELERELAQHHIATLRAIETGRAELAERRLKAYVTFAQAFLDAANKRGITFSLDAARSVSFMDWRIPTLIMDHAFEGVLATLKTNDRELISSATLIPFQLMKMSVEKKDFLFYRRASQIHSAILSTSYLVNTKLEKEIIAELSWRRLRDFAHFYLPKLTAGYDEDTRKQFASELIWRFGDLIKLTLNHNDTSNFALIGREMDSLFHDLHIFGLSQEDALSLETFITQERAIIWFGFGAWIMRSYLSRNASKQPGYPDPRLIDLTHLPVFFEVIAKEFSNIKQLAHVFEHALGYEYSSSTWNSWLMETLPEGQAHWINFRQWLIYFYTVMGIRLSKTGTPDTGDIPDPFRDLEFWMNDIRKDMEEIKADQQNWSDFIPQLSIERIENEVDDTFWDYFISANEAAVKERKRQREDEIIASPVTPQRINEFREECIEGWNQRSWLVKVLSDIGHRVDRKADAETKLWSIDELVPKEAFIESSETHYVGLGREPAMILGRDTTKNLLSTLDNVAQNAGEISIVDTVEKISEIASSISTDISSLAIFSTGDYNLRRQLMTIQSLSPRWTQATPRFDFHEYFGDFGNIPVFFIHSDESSHIMITDLKKAGKLEWFIPEENNVNGLYIKITEIDKEEANRVIDNQPKFLQSEDGSERTREAAIRDLLLKVRIFVGVKIELEITNPEAIKKISIVE